MGYIRHHAIIVTGLDFEVTTPVEQAHKEARRIFDGIAHVSEISSPVDSVNGYITFMVAPDGSKEGWEASDAGDKARAEFLEVLRSPSYVYPDGSSGIDWVLVQFGDDELRTEVVDDSDAVFRERIKEGN